MLNPSRYRIITIGKLRKSWVQESRNFYLKRLPGLSICELRDSSPKKETEAILSTLRKGESPVILGESCESLNSLEFAQRLNNLGNQRIAFIIGGAEGVEPEIKNISSWSLSLSPLTFPHEVAQILLIEQLYRAQSIIKGSPYHRI